MEKDDIVQTKTLKVLFFSKVRRGGGAGRERKVCDSVYHWWMFRSPASSTTFPSDTPEVRHSAFQPSFPEGYTAPGAPGYKPAAATSALGWFLTGALPQRSRGDAHSHGHTQAEPSPGALWAPPVRNLVSPAHAALIQELSLAACLLLLLPNVSRVTLHIHRRMWHVPQHIKLPRHPRELRGLSCAGTSGFSSTQKADETGQGDTRLAASASQAWKHPLRAPGVLPACTSEHSWSKTYWHELYLTNQVFVSLQS